MAKRKIPNSATRKGVRLVDGKPVVVTTRKPKGLFSKIADAALKSRGK